MLEGEFVQAWLAGRRHEPTVDIMRPDFQRTMSAEIIRKFVPDRQQQGIHTNRHPVGEEGLQLVFVPIGPGGNVVVVGAPRRSDFPTEVQLPCGIATRGATSSRDTCCSRLSCRPDAMAWVSAYRSAGRSSKRISAGSGARQLRNGGTIFCFTLSDTVNRWGPHGS
jgi:hypothetical protein